MEKRLVSYYAKSNIDYMKEHKEKIVSEELANQCEWNINHGILDPEYNIDEIRRKATNINNYVSGGWGNVEGELYKHKGLPDWNKYSSMHHSRYFIKEDIEKFPDTFGDEIKKKYDLKVNY